MTFDHERLDVYRHALSALELCDHLAGRLPTGRGHLRDQLDRAVTSVVRNIAEGAGEFSADEKRRFYRMARRSATEAAAILEIVGRRQPALAKLVEDARVVLARVVSMLVALIKVDRP